MKKSRSTTARRWFRALPAPGSVLLLPCLLLGLLMGPGRLASAADRPAATADSAIQELQIRLKLAPDDARIHAALGAAYLQRGRENGDAAEFERAKDELSRSLEINSNDPSAAYAMTQMAIASMAEHRFHDAYEWAERAMATGSGDPAPWGLIGDAFADVGQYAKAEEAYGRMARPGAHDPVAQQTDYDRLSRLSFLSFVHGDTAQAVAQMRQAAGIARNLRLPAESLAWSLYQTGEELFQMGDLAGAEAADREALSCVPGYYRALAGLAKVRAAAGDTREAERLYQQTLAAVPFPEYAAALGDLYRAEGRADLAQRQYDLVEFIGKLSQINAEIHNRDLAYFLADHDRSPGRAVELARRELELRQDIYTWDVLAWALFKNDEREAAWSAMRNALAQGTRDALLFYHAGTMQAALGHPVEASEWLAKALATNPHFHPIHAAEAERLLASLDNAGRSKEESHASR